MPSDIFPKRFFTLQKPPVVDLEPRGDGAVIIRGPIGSADYGGQTQTETTKSTGTTSSSTTSTSGGTSSTTSSGTQTNNAIAFGGLSGPFVGTSTITGTKPAGRAVQKVPLKQPLIMRTPLVDEKGSTLIEDAEIRIDEMRIADLNHVEDSLSQLSLKLPFPTLPGSPGGIFAADDSDEDDDGDTDSESDTDDAGDSDSDDNPDDDRDAIARDGVTIPTEAFDFTPPFSDERKQGRFRH